MNAADERGGVVSDESRAPGSTVAPAGARYEGPFDRTPFPAQITARVVSPGNGEDRRIAGYAVAGDLARNHGMVEVAWLAWRGELPSAAEREAFDTALVLLSPVHVGEAPAHAACLARLSGARPAATVAVSAVGAGELSEHEGGELAPWFAWLAHGKGDVPAAARHPGADVAWTAMQAGLSARMRGWFGAGGALPDVPLRRVACAYAILFHLGMRPGLVLEAMVAWARLPAVIAEASHVRIGAIRDYPARLPDYQYVDDEGAAP